MDDLIWLAQHSSGALRAGGQLTGGIRVDELKWGMDALQALGLSGGGAGVALAVKFLWDRFYKAGSDNWIAAREAMASFAELAKTQREYLEDERTAYKLQLEAERTAYKADRLELDERLQRERERSEQELSQTRAKLEDERGRVDRALDALREAREREAALDLSNKQSAKAAEDARRALELAQTHKDQCERELERLTRRVAELEQSVAQMGDELSEPLDASKTGRHRRVKG